MLNEFFYGGTGEPPAPFVIERSLRFNSGDSSYLNWTPPEVSGDRKRFTISFWTKRANFGTEQNFITVSANPGASSASAARTEFGFNPNNQIKFAVNSSGSSWRSLETLAEFRDSSAWLHIVVVVDTTQDEDSDRVKLYVNGKEQALNGSYPEFDEETPYGSAGWQHTIGNYANNYNAYLDGYLADFYYIDAQTLDPFSFGGYDDNNLWQPKAFDGPYSGAESFHLDFSDNSSDSALGTDSSGLGNNWTVHNLVADNVSNWVASSSGSLFSGSWPQMFDGRLDTGPYVYNTTASVTLTKAISGVIELYVQLPGTWNGNPTVYTLSNGATYTKSTTPAEWISFGNQSNVTSLTVNAPDPGSYIRAIRVDGILLVTTPGDIVDSLIDTPTNYDVESGNPGGNYATFSPIDSSTNNTFSNGNLETTNTGTAEYANLTMGFTSGKWYCEIEANGAGNGACMVGIVNMNVPRTSRKYGALGGLYMYQGTGGLYSGGLGGNFSNDNYASSFADGSIISIVLDMDAGNVNFYINGTDYGQVNTVTLAGAKVSPAVNNDSNSASFKLNTGQRPFAYPLPAGYKPMCTHSFDNPAVADGSSAMDIRLWTGNGGSGGSNQTISGYEFEPQFVWIKNRSSGSEHHALFDQLRGATKVLYTSLSAAEATQANSLMAFTSDGFDLGTDGKVNGLNQAIVGWAWNSGDTSTSVAPGDLNYLLYNQSQTWSNAPYFNDNGFEFYAGDADDLFDNVEAGPGSNGDFPLPVNGGSFTLTFTQFSSAKTVQVVVEGAGNALKINGSFVTLPSGSPAYATYEVDGLTSIEWRYNGGDYCYLGAIWVDGAKLINPGIPVPTNLPTLASTVRANQDAGFSIVTYTGNGTSGATVAHGLNAKPAMVIVKRRNSGEDWFVHHQYHPAQASTPGSFIKLNLSETGGSATSVFDDTDPTSAVVTLGDNNGTNGSGSTYVMYSWAPVEGFSAFGSYQGDGDSNGPFIYTGFRPRWIMVKNATSPSDWAIQDAERMQYNPEVAALYPNTTAQEFNGPGEEIDFLSNGFKLRSSGNIFNKTGQTHIWAAFAEHPFKTARAR